jgi:hypothetical protein
MSDSDSNEGGGYYSDDDSDIEKRESFISAHSNDMGSIVEEPLEILNIHEERNAHKESVYTKKINYEESKTEVK